MDQSRQVDFGTSNSGDWKRIGAIQDIRVVEHGGREEPAAPSGAKAGGALHVQRWETIYLKRLAVATIIVCWVLAGLSALIPIVDLFLVPFFIILGPILAWKVYQKESVVLGGEVTCPRCQRTFEITEQRLHWPIRETCPHCRTRMALESPYLTPSGLPDPEAETPPVVEIRVDSDSDSAKPRPAGRLRKAS